MLTRTIFVLSLAALATACGPAVSITRNATLPIYPSATYAWGLAGGPPVAGERDPSLLADSVRRRIEDAVDAELALHGFRKVAFDSAQLIVHYHVGVKQMVDTLRLATACVDRPCRDPQIAWGYWGAPEPPIREVPYTQGSLILDVLARPSLQVAWRGTISGEVTGRSSSEATIRRGVARLLRDFPGS